MAAKGNTGSKSCVKRNKWHSFKTHWPGRSAISTLWRTKRALLVVALLVSSAVALMSVGAWRAIRSTPSLVHGAVTAGPVKASEPLVTTDPPYTKLKEYVYAGGRMVTSEEISCVPTLGPNSASSPQGGGTGSFDVFTPSTCNWTATSNVGWITVTSGASGSGNDTVGYSVEANSGPQRVGTITVNGQPFTVTQDPNPSSCGYSINNTNHTFPQQGGSAARALTAGAGCAWDAVSSDTSWLTASPTTGVGSATINFSVTPNGGGEQRVGSISIKVGGQTVGSFPVTQAPNQASCTFALSPSSWLSPVGGGNTSFNVDTGAGCQWDASISDGWITINSGAIGVGDGTVSFTAHANNGGSRTGSISIRGQVFTVTQCGYDVSPTSASIGGYGGTGSIAVSSVAGCPWSATSNAWFIHITSGASGSGNGSVNYSVDYFNEWDGYREGTITVAGRTVTIGQSGPPCPFIPPEECPGASQQTGMLLPPGSDAGPKAAQPQPNALSRLMASPLGREGFVLLIASAVLALLFRINWRQARGQFAAMCPGLVLRLYDLRDRIIWFGAAMRRGRRKLAGLLLEIVRTVARQALSLWRNSGVARLKPVLRHALIIAIIVRLALPLTPAQAEGLVRAAQTTWREARAYTSATANRYGAGSGRDLLDRFINMFSGGRPGKVVSAASQTGQVDELQVCPRQLVMFVGERYTLTPVALGVSQPDGSRPVVHRVGMSWSSLNVGVAKVSSFGQVEAKGIGNTTVEVLCGGVSKQIPIEVRSGRRDVSSNQQADIDPTNDCSAEQSAAFASQSAAVASAQQGSVGNEGVSSDGDPEPQTGSNPAAPGNAVGNPRFAATSQGGGGVPTHLLLGSDNYQFNVPVTSVGGRGASAGIGLTLNSRVWNKDNGKLTFNYVGAYPAPGWTMGYGKIIRNYNATATGNHSGVGSGNNPGDYLLVTGNGTRIRLAAKYKAATDRWLHESDDGSFLQFDLTSGEMRYPDGSRMIYSSVNGCLLPTAMINTNGGAITMTYRDYCEGACQRVFRRRTALSAVRDTLGRYVTFHYYGDNDYQADAAAGKPEGALAAIKAPDREGVQQEVIRVHYDSILLQYDFGAMAVDAPANNSPIQVVQRIYYPRTGRGFLFQDYSSYGMPRKISSYMSITGAGEPVTDGTEIAYTKYNYMTIASDPNDPPYDRNQVGTLFDSPQFTHREEWWQDKTDADGTLTTLPTQYKYSRTPNASTEEMRIEYIGKNCEEVTTTGTDSGQLSFGKVISVERKKLPNGEVLSKQVFTYMTGPDGGAQIEKIEGFDEDGQGTLVSFGYGPYGRLTDRYEYGYKQGGVYQVRRRTQTEYVDIPLYTDARFLRLVSRVSIHDAAGQMQAKTEYVHDDYAAMGGIESYGLATGLYPPNHDDTYDEDNELRGNVTAVKTFSNIASGEPTTRRMKYDIFGNVVEAELSCCVKKFFSFSPLTYYSQPDWVRSGPDSETELNLKTSYQYNNFTGQVDNETNPDGLLTLYEYDDKSLRLQKATNHATGAEVKTQFEQDGNGNDLLAYISQTRYDDQGTEKVITSKRWFNGAGQVIRAGTGTGNVPDSYDMTAAVYDGWGRVAKQSNPYLGDANGELQAGGALFWTINTYDELSRVTEVILPDDQRIKTTYHGATATSGATVITKDTVGRRRMSEVDGLGRLVKVTEPNPANGNLEWETSYSYDALNNLTQINKDGQLRTFTYDNKGRLKSETIPEAGTTEYTYTNFDAVETRKDARGVITTYTYGPLNLLTKVEHDTTNAPGVAPTAPVNIDYKISSFGKGQIERVTDGLGREDYGYDDFGRLQSRERVIDDIKYKTQYEYNNAGQMTLMIYPSNKRVKVEHDARGRLSALQRVGDSGATQESYLSGINYRADGLISSQNLGDETTESFGYSNDRLQLTSQEVKKGENTLLSLNYGYGAAAGQMGSGTSAGNSGQLVTVTGTINGQGRNQAFTYDNVGRLVTATGWGAWERRYEYDQYGNRTKVWDAVSGGNTLQNTVVEQQAGGMKTNRIASVNGTVFRYDASGNVTEEGVARVYGYDAENRLVSVSVSGVGSESYGYDAGNRRVKKVEGGVVTHYVREGDKVISEYEYGGGATSAIGTRYYHQDRLSTRVITGSAGNVVGTTDHLPFGEEIGVSGESEKHKFTTYERDQTTGLDYAVNRHYDPRQGRFNQADPLGMGAVSLANPQSLNLYSYVGNDPGNRVDPTGLQEIPTIRESVTIIASGGSTTGIDVSGGALSGGDGGIPFIEMVDFGGERGGGETQGGTGELPVVRDMNKIIDDFYKKYGAKLNRCLKEIFGRNDVPRQTRENAPVFDTRFKIANLPGKKGAYGSLDSTMTLHAPYGTVYIASDVVSSPGKNALNAIYGTMAHEIGNKVDYDVNGVKGNGGTYGRPKDPDNHGDGDTGVRVERCVFGGKMQGVDGPYQ